jgi:hypothetical protein
MKPLCVLLLLLLPLLALAQDPASGSDVLLERKLDECPLNENGGIPIILDNTRTKAGKDFYELFYKQWTLVSMQADTSQLHQLVTTVQFDEVVISVEEIPAPGFANQVLIQITIDDQPVWHQYVPVRYELLEAEAPNAVETARQELASYREMKQLVGSQQ